MLNSISLKKQSDAIMRLTTSIIVLLLISGCAQVLKQKETRVVKPEVVQRAAISFIGTTVRTTNQDEMNEQTAKIAGNWNQFFSQGIASQIPNKVGDDIFGVYSHYETDASGLYNLTVALEVKPNTDAEGSLKQIDAAAARYLKFTAQGEMPGAVIETWQQIWQYFTDSSHGHQRAYTVDFEYYDANTPDKVDIFIAIK